jgi:hypothetical protein
MMLKMAGAILLLALVLIVTGCGGGGATQFRVMNASFGENSLNVLVDGTTVASNVAYGTATAYMTVTSGSHQIQMEAPGSSTPFINQQVAFDSGTDTTILDANSSSSPTALIFTDTNSAPSSGNATVRFINAAPSLASADAYILPPGTLVVGSTPLVSSLGFKLSSGYQTVATGSYDVTFTVAGVKSAEVTGATDIPITLSSHQIRTIVLLNSAFSGYETVVLPDLN